MPDTFAASGLACIRGERIVFEDLDFSLTSGSALLLRGPNGSGKSSLLRLCAAFLAPAAGALTWNGTPITADRDAHRARIAWAGHLDAVKPAFTVAANLAFWLGLAPGGAALAVDTALGPLGLGHLADLPAAYLSAGQKRRLNLSRLSGSRAPLWLLDEPTSSLDDASARALLAVINRHCDGGGMAIIATHQDLALDRVATLTMAAP
ncbi:MAG: heme ABC exporter ATP-binding protein CcmA [Alphaproteobacteria bacterium]|nr:heme ABC exporter ATP-binding protein CcmA [Alphaproteobacteria bacterium]